MKKIIAILMLCAIALSFASCGAINDTEVSVLWSDMSDELLFTYADALDRAMYIENINHTDYDAEGSAEKQIAQAKAAIAADAAALIVNATDVATATVILGAAKDAGKPIVFLCNDLDLDVLAKTYDKCAIVNLDKASLTTTLAEKIAADLIANYDAYDRDDNGKISYCAFGLSAAVVPAVNELLKAEGKEELEAELAHMALPTIAVTESINAIFKDYNGDGDKVNATPVELILTDDDGYVEELLLALRGYKLNHKKLVTHFIPLYTVGVAANAGELIDTDVKEERDAYSVMNTIDNGFVSAAALEDDDAIALSAAAIVRNFIKGNATLEGVNKDYIVDGKVLVPYTIYE